MESKIFTEDDESTMDGSEWAAALPRKNRKKYSAALSSMQKPSPATTVTTIGDGKMTAPTNLVPEKSSCTNCTSIEKNYQRIIQRLKVDSDKKDSEILRLETQLAAAKNIGEKNEGDTNETNLNVSKDSKDRKSDTSRSRRSRR